MRQSSVLVSALGVIVLFVSGCATPHLSETLGSNRDSITITPGITIRNGMTMAEVRSLCGDPADTTSYRYEEFEIKDGKKTVTHVEQMPAWYYYIDSVYHGLQEGEVQVLFRDGKVVRLLVYEKAR